ncbi:MAG TPA: ABC transporter [Verrucomicrobiales bacterium]|nr:ABC transporter [Verrucomicrobiales bacterium]
MPRAATEVPVLDVRHLSIRRGRTVILRDVTWRVRAGEHWVILGANGSGKTSLLSALTGYFSATEGEIELLGQRFGEADWRELRTQIGLVSSSVRLMMAETETALETVVTGKYAMIDYWGRIKPADARKARGILSSIECTHLADRPWAVLSQGERQRILIGRALMCRPRLLILDEPCAGLDPVAREHFLQFVNRLGRQKDSPTLVLVTHHVEEIMPVFSHVLLLRDGTVQAAGRKSAMLSASHLTAAFKVSVHPIRSAGRYQLRVASDRQVVI